MLIQFLIFRNTRKILVKHPNTDSDLNRSVLQITIKLHFQTTFLMKQRLFLTLALYIS